MIIRSVCEISSPPLFYHLKGFLDESELYVKLEGLNIAGSIKLTTAIGLIDALEKAGKIKPQTQLIESSSGNLGVALSMLCKAKGYAFTCVTDPNISAENEKLIVAYGARLIKVHKKDHNGGYLNSRIELIQEYLQSDKHYIWINQYANINNPNAHYNHTGKQILDQFRSSIDYLFIGAGTTGTLMGCARLFKERSSHTKVIGVDSAGSVTFGGCAKKRHIPGLGTSRRPEIANREHLDELVYVEELDAIDACRHCFEQYGLLLGGSSGSVLAAIKQYAFRLPSGSTVVTISPDFGFKYLEMIYNDQWVSDKFSEQRREYALPQ